MVLTVAEILFVKRAPKGVFKLHIVDELDFVPLSKTGAELLFELISQRYERASTLITNNRPTEWTETLGSGRLTGALLDRGTHQVNILEMNGDSYRLAQNHAERLAETLPKIADAASEKLWSATPSRRFSLVAPGGRPLRRPVAGSYSVVEKTKPNFSSIVILAAGLFRSHPFAPPSSDRRSHARPRL